MDQHNTVFNLSDIAQLIARRNKFIASFVLIAVAVATVLVFWVLPPQYKSTAVVVAANPLLADKANLFNDNIEGLYSAYGSEDDLNRLFGIATLDTTFKVLVDKFDLVSYYKIKGEDYALKQRKAIDALREDIELTKTELYQLKISATTKDKTLSASIANNMVEIVHAMMKDVWKKANESSLQKLESSTLQLEKDFNQLIDSTGNDLSGIKKQGMLQQIQQNEKIANQLKIALANDARALIVLEKAYPAAKPDKPKKVLTILAAFFASLAFSIIAIILFERR